jgi:tRNA(Arg) A34 adenosine deaminase TadA
MDIALCSRMRAGPHNFAVERPLHGAGPASGGNRGRRGPDTVGAVVLDAQGRLIGQGHNRVRADLDLTAHGEVVAIRVAWRRLGAWPMLAGGTLYSSCEPCLLCSFVITQVGLRRVVFAARATDVPTYKPLLAADLTAAAARVNAQSDWARLDIVGDFMRDRAVKIMAKFPWTQAGTRSAVKSSPPAASP